jgi:hypothetical protein
MPAATPAFSLHDLHRRAWLWHLAGMPFMKASDERGHSPHVYLGLQPYVVLYRMPSLTMRGSSQQEAVVTDIP